MQYWLWSIKCPVLSVMSVVDARHTQHHGENTNPVYACVCIFICGATDMYVCMHVLCINVCEHVCLCAHTCVFLCVAVFVPTYT